MWYISWSAYMATSRMFESSKRMSKYFATPHNSTWADGETARGLLDAKSRAAASDSTPGVPELAKPVPLSTSVLDPSEPATRSPSGVASSSPRPRDVNGAFGWRAGKPESCALQLLRPTLVEQVTRSTQVADETKAR